MNFWSMKMRISLRAHREDVANDNIICSANFLCFVETWTLPDKHISVIAVILPKFRK